ncbi:DDE-type integrase/transposase/recombinase [Paenibacillus sp. FSL K6-0276]|uniref:DDE-type integrase/transposase/recombinase n=1 Tax=Paenibacillus sp. FSL K6-0276 TaxID=2921450 RepID=UPI0030ED4FA0
MNRNFDANSPTSKWCTDVTELKYGNGRKAYLSAIIDVYDNSIVSWVLSPSNNNKLVMDTLKRAYAKNPSDFGLPTSQKAIILQSMTPMKMSSQRLANIFTTTIITATQNVWMDCLLTNTDELHNEDTSALVIRAEVSKLTIFVF